MDAPGERLSGAAARKSPVVLLIAAITLGVVLAAGVWALMQEPPAPSLRLPGGAVLHLKGIDYGKRYVLREQKLWQQLFGPVLPESLQGREVIRGSSPRERLTLWFRPENDPQPWHVNRRLEAVDEHGCRFDGGFELGMPLRERFPYRKGSLLLFPRRSGSFRLQMTEEGAASATGELAIANPAPGPHPTWQPEPLPASRRVGRLEVRLLSLTAGLTREALLREPWGAVLDDGDAPLPPAWRTHSWARAAFRIREDGRPTDRWRIAQVTVSDATGNGATYPNYEQCSYLTPWSQSRGSTQSVTDCPTGGCIRGTGHGRGELWIAFPSLCVRESAWKLRPLLSYVGPVEDRPADLNWTIPGIPAVRPFKETKTYPIAVQSWPGIRLLLGGVHGRGALNTEKLADAANARVFLNATPGDGLSLALTGTDERGRPVGVLLLCKHGHGPLPPLVVRPARAGGRAAADAAVPRVEGPHRGVPRPAGGRDGSPGRFLIRLAAVFTRGQHSPTRMGRPP